MSRGYLTSFSADDTLAIHAQIKKLASNHNRLIRRELYISIESWRNVVLPPEVRQLSLQAQKAFGSFFASAAYTSSIDLGNIDDFARGEYVFVNWGAHKEAFPRAANVQQREQLYHDADPDFAGRFYECMREWRAAAVDYGFATETFNWLNGRSDPSTEGFCGKGGRRLLRTFMPSVVPLVSRFNPSLAASLSKPVTSLSTSLPLEAVQVVQRANQIIAAALLLPKAEESSDGVALSLGLDALEHPLSGRSAAPITSL